MKPCKQNMHVEVLKITRKIVHCDLQKGKGGISFPLTLCSKNIHVNASKNELIYSVTFVLFWLKI